MQLQKKKSSKKPLLLASTVLAVIAVGVFIYFWQAKSSGQASDSRTTQPAEQKPTTQKTTQPDKTKGETSHTTSTAPSESHEKEKEITPAYEGTDTNNSASLSGVITYSAVAGSNLVIRTTINQSLSSGTCQLVLTNGSKSITKTSNIMPNPSSSTCEGFDVPTAELGSGNWDIAIKVSSGDRSGTLTGSAKL